MVFKLLVLILVIFHRLLAITMLITLNFEQIILKQEAKH